MVTKTIPKKQKYKKAKWFSEEDLQIAEKISKKQGRKGRQTQLNAEFQRVARSYKKAFLREQYEEIEENNTVLRLEISSRNLEIVR